MKHYTAEPWLPSHSGLGESPLYRASDNTFFFVDIKNKLVHGVPLSPPDCGWAGRHTVEPPEPVTRLHAVRGRDDVLAVQTRLGFALLHTATGELERIADVHHHGDEDGDGEKGLGLGLGLDDRVRMNDGAVDARGRWWAGTMALDEESDVGRLWCLTRDGDGVATVSAHAGSSGAEDGLRAAVPNGPVFSPDDRVMYACDTPRGKIYAFDYDVESGRASRRRLFAQLGEDAGGGMPDGLAVDVEGHVWAAANSTGRLVRLAPGDGSVVAECVVPGAKMTSCPVFGGHDMKTLFITSIAADASSGDVYRVMVDVAGVERYAYRV